MISLETMPIGEVPNGGVIIGDPIEMCMTGIKDQPAAYVKLGGDITDYCCAFIPIDEYEDIYKGCEAYVTDSKAKVDYIGITLRLRGGGVNED